MLTGLDDTNPPTNPPRRRLRRWGLRAGTMAKRGRNSQTGAASHTARSPYRSGSPYFGPWPDPVWDAAPAESTPLPSHGSTTESGPFLVPAARAGWTHSDRLLTVSPRRIRRVLRAFPSGTPKHAPRTRQIALYWPRIGVGISTPSRVYFCVKRKQRREVLFARKVAGHFRRSPGRGGSYRRTQSSYYRC